MGRSVTIKRKNSLFLFPVYGMMVNEALVVIANLSQLMATKLYEPILYITGWVNVLVAITVARSYSRVLRGY